jgi:hypothetical protein
LPIDLPTRLILEISFIVLLMYLALVGELLLVAEGTGLDFRFPGSKKSMAFRGAMTRFSDTFRRPIGTLGLARSKIGLPKLRFW